MQNYSTTLLSSAARTATTASSDQTNQFARGVQVTVDCTASASTPSVVFKVQGYDPTSAKYYDLLTSAAVTGTSTTTLTVYPGATAVTNVAVSAPLPRTWRVSATHADTDSITYSVGANLIL